MTTTINISLPTEMYKKAKSLVSEGKYNSISEVIRAGLRRTFYEADKITENGFPGWFEDHVLEVEDRPEKNDIVLESEEDVHKYFKKVHKKVAKKRLSMHDKDRNNGRVHPVTQ